MSLFNKSLICCIATIYLLSDIGLAFSRHHCNCHFLEQFSEQQSYSSCNAHDEEEPCADLFANYCHDNTSNSVCHNNHGKDNKLDYFNCCTSNFKYLKLDIPQNLSEGKYIVQINAVVICKKTFNFYKLQLEKKAKIIYPDYIPLIYRKILHNNNSKTLYSDICQISNI